MAAQKLTSTGEAGNIYQVKGNERGCRRELASGAQIRGSRINQSFWKDPIYQEKFQALGCQRNLAMTFGTPIQGGISQSG